MQVKSHTYNYFSDTISEVLTNFLSLLPWFGLVIYIKLYIMLIHLINSILIWESFTDSRNCDEKSFNSPIVQATFPLNSPCCAMLSHSVMSDSLWPTRLLCPENFSGKNTGVGCHFLLQGIFLTQGLSPHLLHWQQILYHCANCEAIIS